MPVQSGRREAILETVERVREIESNCGVTRESLKQVKRVLIQFAMNVDWFTDEEFPPIKTESSETSCFYRLAEDEETHRFALYVQSARAPVNLPPHNHDTWAVIAGIRGDEVNRFYERTPNGICQTGCYTVRKGTGVAMLPDDIHSIHIADETPVVNFHMYGLGLEYLYNREYFDYQEKKWKIFPVYDNIRDAMNI